MKLVFICFLVLFFVGCAQIQQHEASSYVSTNKPLAESGSMKWSDYYKGLYEKVAQIKVNGTGQQLMLINNMISISLDYEAGKITKEQFDAATRDARAKESMLTEQVNGENAENRARSMLIYQQTQNNLRQSQQQYQVQQYKPIPPPINCRSYQTGNTVNTTCQ